MDEIDIIANSIPEAGSLIDFIADCIPEDPNSLIMEYKLGEGFENYIQPEVPGEKPGDRTKLAKKRANAKPTAKAAIKKKSKKKKKKDELEEDEEEFSIAGSVKFHSIPYITLQP